MKMITLRNLPASLDRTIRQRAKQKGVSVNKVVISLLQDHLGESEMWLVRRYHDLDGLAGSWSKQEAEASEPCHAGGSCGLDSYEAAPGRKTKTG